MHLPNLAALRARLPVLAPAEKAALWILVALLASGAALRAWERSGVSFGPVDDWDALRALVVEARAADPTPWPCADAPEAGFAAAGFVRAKNGDGEVAKGEGKRKAKTPKARKTAAKDSERKRPSSPIDLNAAGERQLGGLPGVGPSTAKAILAWRAAHGPFSTPEDLMKVKGIGPKKFEALRPFIKVAGSRGTTAPENATGTSPPGRNAPSDSVSRSPDAGP